MGTTGYLVRVALRRRGRSMALFTLVVGLFGGLVLAAATGARRTDTVYERFETSARAWDVLVVNYPEDGTAVFDLDALARTPGVDNASRVFFEYGGPDPGYPLIADPDGVLGVEMNRHKVLDGRLADPDDPAECVIGFELAERHGLGVGETIESFVTPEIVDEFRDQIAPDELALLDRFFAAVPDGRLRIVGITATPGDIPPVAQPYIYGTPALARLFPAESTEAGRHEALAVRLDDDASLAAFLDRLEEDAHGLDAQVVVHDDLRTSVARGLDLQTYALWLVASLVAVAGVLALGQAFSRMAGAEADELAVLRSLGTSRGARFGGLLGRAALTGVAGAAVAVVVAVALSPLTPIGLAHRIEPDPGVAFDAVASGLGALAVATATIVIALVPAWSAARGAVDIPPRPGRIATWVTALGGGPAASAGLRLTFDRRRGPNAVPIGTTIVGVVVGVAAVAAALVLGASLERLTSEPRLQGLGWDAQLSNFVDDEVVTSGVDHLRDDSRVVGVGVGQGALGDRIEVNGVGVGLVVVDNLWGENRPPLARGRYPNRDGEIALGARTRRAADAAIGDRVRVSAGSTTLDLTVVGDVVVPAFDPSTQLGTGALLTADGARRLVDDLSVGTLFVNIRDGVDLADVVGDLNEELENPVYVLDSAAASDLVNFGRVDELPMVLAGIVAALAMASLAHTLFSGLRRRRRDFAVLRSLGFVRRQVAAAISWHATLISALGIAVGLPLGIAAGRAAWRAITDELGVIDSSRVPVVAMTLVVPALVLLSNVVAAAPGRSASSLPTALALRSE
jgi:ABC-type lipoprotein release transport system permease subunit